MPGKKQCTRRGSGWEIIDPRAGWRNPWLAAVLSVIWPGLGQAYTGRWGKAALLFFGQIANLVLLFVTIGFLSVPLLWLWGVVDAYGGGARTREATRRALTLLSGRSGL